eukprot:CAMPEP_0202898474 /NCGR_PEP_ID=MMETSP1392-20130828/6989_1 /ASSEMBLY_ACC=CAM_ASM_000868 /TAXON_ID=225041 /ORGANISM="Chlamydomonas chlamydogama, Strain SAG 11-48b" /LENGTH=648 /DNA_ID=CAMNT_0049584415 /DNA_START=109 /DNA_END=2053 /DNA_ORIENTATION=-
MQPFDAAVQLSVTGSLQVTQLPSGLSDEQLQRLLDAEPNLVWARYWPTYESIGWDRLEISVIPAIPLSNSIKARAAGYAEGHFQADRIYDYWLNYRVNEFRNNNGRPSKGLLSWISQQEEWLRRQIKKHAVRALHRATARATAARTASDPEAKYWGLMGLVMDQFDGFCDGFWDAALPGRNLSRPELYLLQSIGDLYDLLPLFPPNATLSSTQQYRQHRQYTPGHGIVGAEGYGAGELLECSALIKLDTDGYPQTQMEQQRKHRQQQQQPGQAQDAQHQQQPETGPGQLQQEGSQRSSGAARRLLVQQQKQAARIRSQGGPDAASRQQGGSGERLPGAPAGFWVGHTTWRPYYAMMRTWKVYDLPWTQSGPVTVSSSPGLVGYSKDDWYTTDRFVVMETTNGVYNASLYDLITPQSALMWQRVQVANWGASDGAEWAHLFSLHNSGTYNNQWMVLDVERLMEGHKTDVLWVLEQLPGLTEQADVSAVLLGQGYWASYNVPFFPHVYNISGYPQDKDLYSTSPRARIFARDAPGVDSLDSFKTLLRLNRYQDDPLSGGRPNDAIASRYDLEPLPSSKPANWTARPFGAVDGKIATWEDFPSRRTHAICGPTYDDQPPFSWSEFESGSEAAQGARNYSHVGVADLFDFEW